MTITPFGVTLNSVIIGPSWPNAEEEFGGASRDRTDDLIVANDALSQLSYSPV